MAAKVLLGVVALAAVVGSPFAYNHFKSSSEETQKEGEAKNEQAVAEKPANTAPEVAKNVQEASAQDPEQKGNDQAPSENGGAKGPVTDPCNLEGTQTWDSTGGALSSQNQCVRQVVQDKRQGN